MPQAVSIHLGVNRPAGPHSEHPLRFSEDSAWCMAGLAGQAGYDALQLLRGGACTRAAVHDVLTRAAGSLRRGDTLFVSYSGHGSQVLDDSRDERGPFDQEWCLADGVLVDDRLIGYWRLFDPGVRIVLVVESCFSGGMGRDDDDPFLYFPASPGEPVMRGGGGGGYRGSVERGHRGGGWRSAQVMDYASSCIAEAPKTTDGIRASVLMLTASGEDETSRDGLFSQQLLKVWNHGRFEGSYCDLYRAVREGVTHAHCQHPQIQMLGASDPGFPLEPAFRRDRSAPAEEVVYR